MSAEHEVRIRRLEKSDRRERFTCGDEELDRFFRRFAGQNQFRHHVGVTYVACKGSQILGFATVSHASIEIEDLPAKSKKKFPRYPLPVLRFARLATAVEARGLGLGKALLRFVLQLSLQADEMAGCVGVVVDAKPNAREFYARYGFEELDGVLEGASGVRPAPTTMFLPLGSIPRGEQEA